MHTEARCWLEWMGWLPKTVAHANPSRIQRVGETSASAEGTEDNSSLQEERRRWIVLSAECTVASSAEGWEGNPPPPPHLRTHLRVVGFSCYSCLLFFSCYSCLFFFSCYCLACFSFLLILACFSFLLILAGFSFLLFVFLAGFSFLVLLAGFSFLVLLAGFSEDLEAPCATHSADAMQLEPHGSASAGTSSFAIQAHCFGRAIEHLRKVQLHVLPERVQRLGGLDGRTLSRKFPTGKFPTGASERVVGFVCLFVLFCFVLLFYVLFSSICIVDICRLQYRQLLYIFMGRNPIPIFSRSFPQNKEKCWHFSLLKSVLASLTKEKNWCSIFWVEVFASKCWFQHFLGFIGALL